MYNYICTGTPILSPCLDAWNTDLCSLGGCGLDTFYVITTARLGLSQSHFIGEMVSRKQLSSLSNFFAFHNHIQLGRPATKWNLPFLRCNFSSQLLKLAGKLYYTHGKIGRNFCHVLPRHPIHLHEVNDEDKIQEDIGTDLYFCILHCTYPLIFFHCGWLKIGDRRDPIATHQYDVNHFSGRKL